MVYAYFKHKRVLFFFVFPFYYIFIIDTTIMLLIFPNIIINMKKKKNLLRKYTYSFIYSHNYNELVSTGVSTNSVIESKQVYLYSGMR
jgi:hypothetical protein